jgi:hypothetical protein
VTRTRPEEGCHDLVFRDACAVDEAGELALEDYARTVAGAGAAEVIRDAGEGAGVRGVHLCAVGAPAAAAVGADIEGFARSLAEDRPHGLGWS